MEIKATLNKPYTDKERADFIVANNHNKGYEIQETADALLAVYNEPLPPTKEEQEQNRANAYQQEVDPITSHISRLRDTNPMTEEIEQEIAQLIEERDAKVEEIKERYPYPVGEEEDLEESF